MAPGPQGPARVAREALLLLAVAVLATALSWSLRSDGLPLAAEPSYYELELSAPLVDVQRALDLYAEGRHIFVDTRPAAEREAGTIPGALPVSQENFDDDLLEVFDFLLPEDPVVLFGSGNLLGASNVAARLADRGFTDLLILNGGLQAWRKAGGEFTAPPAERPEEG